MGEHGGWAPPTAATAAALAVEMDLADICAVNREPIEHDQIGTFSVNTSSTGDLFLLSLSLSLPSGLLSQFSLFLLAQIPSDARKIGN